MNIIEVRKQKRLTQKEAAQIVGIPYRTYIRYEENASYLNTYKYRLILESLLSKTKIDEEHGILSLEDIKRTLVNVLKKHDINYCYLFGSYAKGEARENSDIDLLVDTDLTGLKFYSLVDEIRNALNKKIDLLRLKDLETNNPIVLEILKEGIRII